MLNGVIVINQDIGHNAYKIKRFNEEFPKLGINFVVVTNDGSLAKIKDSSLVFSLPPCDFVIYLDKDIYFARELEKAGYRLFNPAAFIKLCDDKMLTSIALSNNNIPMPKTIAGPLVYSSLKESNYNFLKTVEQELGYPLVMKRVYGSLGEGVFLFHNYKELKNYYSQYYNQPILFQEYIASSYGKSMRVLIIDQQVVGGFIRLNQNDFRSNYGASASSMEAKGYEEFFTLSKRIADILKIEYAGIDFLFDKNNHPILCEINSNAFFEEFEKITKINVAKKIGEMIKRKLEK